MNDTITELLREYSLPEMVKRATITFDASGIAALPSDYFRMVKLWETDTTGIQLVEYNWLEPADFDQHASTDSYYWTEDYITADAARKLKCLPIDSGTIDIRYVITPGTVDTSSLVDSKLSSLWDSVVAFGAAKMLFLNAGRVPEAQIVEREYLKRKASTYLSIKNRGGTKQNPKLISKYARRTLLDR
jgi:hypothetical protein